MGLSPGSRGRVTGACGDEGGALLLSVEHVEPVVIDEPLTRAVGLGVWGTAALERSAQRIGGLALLVAKSQAVEHLVDASRECSELVVERFEGLAGGIVEGLAQVEHGRACGVALGIRIDLLL